MTDENPIDLILARRQIQVLDPNDKNSQMLTRMEFLIKYKVRNADRRFFSPVFFRADETTSRIPRFATTLVDRRANGGSSESQISFPADRSVGLDGRFDEFRYFTVI